MSAAGSVPAPVSPESEAVRQRYKDAYLVAGAVGGVGTAIKAVGIILGVLLVLGGALADSIATIPALLLAIVVGVFFFVLGTLISAQGQVLKAGLDTAVNTSPFLTNDQRALSMSLPVAYSSGSEAQPVVAHGCPKCGSKSTQVVEELAGAERWACNDCGHKWRQSV